MGEDTITMDYDGVLTLEQLREIEVEANQVVVGNHPILSLFPTVEELKRIPYRSKEHLDLCNLHRSVLICIELHSCMAHQRNGSLPQGILHIRILRSVHDTFSFRNLAARILGRLLWLP